MKKKIKSTKKGEEYYRHTATDAYDEAIVGMEEIKDDHIQGEVYDHNEAMHELGKRLGLED